MLYKILYSSGTSGTTTTTATSTTASTPATAPTPGTLTPGPPGAPGAPPAGAQAAAAAAQTAAAITQLTDEQKRIVFEFKQKMAQLPPDQQPAFIAQHKGSLLKQLNFQPTQLQLLRNNHIQLQLSRPQVRTLPPTGAVVQGQQTSQQQQQNVIKRIFFILYIVFRLRAVTGYILIQLNYCPSALFIFFPVFTSSLEFLFQIIFKTNQRVILKLVKGCQNSKR